MVHRAPPQPVVETIVVSPGPNYVWVKGHYTWIENNWVWVRGGWVASAPTRRILGRGAVGSESAKLDGKPLGSQARRARGASSPAARLR